MVSDKKAYRSYEILGEQYTLPLTNSANKTKNLILMEATILFAKNGYSAVSMRELADRIGIKQASLYNHFVSKEALWEAVLDHALYMYTLYFNELGKVIENAENFDDVLEILFFEAKRLKNLFTCYAFGLVQMEQLRDSRAADFYNRIFLEYSIDFVKGKFDLCVENGWAKPFDTKTVATMFMNSILAGLNLKVQDNMGRPVPYDPSEMFASMQKLIYSIGTAGLEHATGLPE